MIMKNGYYLFVYSCVDVLLNYYGMSNRSDHNMALFKLSEENIELIHHWEFERVSGEKHHSTSFENVSVATQFINSCLLRYDLSINDLVAIYGTDGLSKDVVCESELFKIYPYHSLCHLMSCLFMNSENFYNKKMIGLALDGGPDLAIDPLARTKKFYCGAVVNHGNITFHHIPSPAVLWLFASKHFHEPEGTLMALAYATESKTLEDLKWDKAIWGLNEIHAIEDKVVNLIKHVWDYTECDIGIKCTEFDNRFTQEENKMSIVMKVIQEMSIEMVDNTVASLVDKYNLQGNETVLAVSGGYALNCPTNSFLMHKYKFLEFVAPPAVNDGGQAVGMGLLHFYTCLNKVNFVFPSAYLGDSDKLENLNDIYKKYVISIENTLEKFADDIETAPIIWFEGRAESGPRALGHRSILASPSNISTKELLNQYKGRQWWRPVAPIILEEEKDKWFKDIFKSPYMLNNFSVLDNKKALIPEVLHLDNTARVQTLNMEEDSLLFNALNLYYLKTGIPILANTSLNDKGEPIINTINEAFNFALRKKISIMYVDGKRICLDLKRQYKNKSPENRWSEIFESGLSYQDMITIYNPYRLTPEEVLLYKRHKDIGEIDLTIKENVRWLKKFLSKIRAIYVKDIDF